MYKNSYHYKWRTSDECKDCNKKINKYSKNNRCIECWNKWRKGKKENKKTIISNCILCNTKFEYYSGAYRGLSKKYCSKNCYQKSRIIKSSKKCPQCSKTYFKGKHTSQTTVCSKECYSKRRSEMYKGVNHPKYKNGRQIDRGSKACYNYSQNIIKEKGYKYCENCGVNNSFKFEVHHIIYRSEKPKHKNLHDSKNLILVCLDCHHYFHSGKSKEKRKKLVEERNLKKLFEDNNL